MGIKKVEYPKIEKVFEILGEGGGICIYRKSNELIDKFIYSHNEFDPTDEDLDVNKNEEYDNFEQAFQLINDRYSWYMLHIETVHDDYKKFISEKLIEKLNNKSITFDYLAFRKDSLENSLGVKLNYCCNQQINEFVWIYENIK